MSTLLTAEATLPRAAHATIPVEDVVSASGIRAYLIREPSLPFLSLSIYMRGGSAGDPKDRPGLAYMAANLLDEGAGAYDSQAFRVELEDHAIRLSFGADRDGISGELKTLTRNREHAFELLRLALASPRFDAEPVQRVRGQVTAQLRQLEANPEFLAARGWFRRAFEGHPYASPTRGTPESIGAISRDELQGFVTERIGRDGIMVGAAGDITAEELGQLLDHAFGGLPATSHRPTVPAWTPLVDGEAVHRLPIPQSVVIFGHQGIPRLDPDYYAAYLANHILGSGGFSSRLMEEVREKRGLAYSVHSYLYDLEAAPLWLGSVATKNEQVAESLRLIRHEAGRMAEGDIAEHELSDAQTYLTGSFALRLTSNDQVAKMLVGMLQSDLGIDYLDRRNPLIEAVSLEDVRRISARLFAGRMLISAVGDPQGLASEGVPAPA